jgi:hypothetical protein
MFANLMLDFLSPGIFSNNRDFPAWNNNSSTFVWEAPGYQTASGLAGRLLGPMESGRRRRPTGNAQVPPGENQLSADSEEESGDQTEEEG